jgi:outer membrane protein OmpA-like peptidoglycan-associated protein
MHRQLFLTVLMAMLITLSGAWAQNAGTDSSAKGSATAKSTPQTSRTADSARATDKGRSTEIRHETAAPILVAAGSSPANRNVRPSADTILFDFEKTLLKDSGRAQADRLVARLKENTKDTVIVEGHTCMEADAEFIMTLGQRRAEAVKKYMVDRGIEPERIKVESCGEAKPAAPLDTPPNRKLNRRVEVQYVSFK